MAQHREDEREASSEQRILEDRKATDKISGNPHALIKPIYGDEGVRKFVTTANPFPVTVSAGGASISPKFARIDHTTTTAVEIVAAVSGKKIRVTALALYSIDTTIRSVVFLSATTEIAGPYQLIAGTPTSPIILVPDANGYFETVANEALNLKLAFASLVAGSLVYIEV